MVQIQYKMHGEKSQYFLKICRLFVEIRGAMNCHRVMIFVVSFLLFHFFDIYSFHNIEQTFAMIKPNAVQKERVAEIIKMIQRSGFKIIAIDHILLTQDLMEQLYKDYVLRSWFRKYVKSMTAQPAVVMVLEKNNAVASWLKLKKKIRKHYREYLHNNSVHGADSEKEAAREIRLFFPKLGL